MALNGYMCPKRNPKASINDINIASEKELEHATDLVITRACTHNDPVVNVVAACVQ